MISSIDQFGQLHEFREIPQRIVSLVPSITELLCDLGLESSIVGRTKFCCHPTHLQKNTTSIGGTKSANITDIIELTPEIIFANKEENTKEDVFALRPHCPVWVSDVSTLTDADEMRHQVANLFSLSADAITKSVNKSILDFKTKSRQRVAYLIWRKPYMTIGGDTFIHHMLSSIGFKNAFKTSERYPEVKIEELAVKELDVILLSSEPYPFRQKDIDELIGALPSVEVRMVDGEYFYWYGSRQLHCNRFYI